MADDHTVVRGPWRRLALRCVEPSRAEEPGVPKARARVGTGKGSAGRPRLAPNKMMLGFIIRDLAVELGHPPSPEELLAWANHQCDERGEFCLFGRAITLEEARVILRHPGRPVTVRPERQRPKVEPIVGDFARGAAEHSEPQAPQGIRAGPANEALETSLRRRR